MTRTWLHLALACSLSALAALMPVDNGVTDYSPGWLPPERVVFDAAPDWVAWAERQARATWGLAADLEGWGRRSIDRTAPPAPRIVTPSESQRFPFPVIEHRGSFGVPPLELPPPVPELFVSGFAEPGSLVFLSQGEPGVSLLPLGGARADDHGQWAVRTLPFGGLMPSTGAMTLYATATDAVGNVSPASSVHLILDLRRYQRSRP
jgi:hypothetical protein